MSLKEAAQILDMLAQGIDPDSGEVLPPENVVNSPKVIRALFLASRALAAQSKPQSTRKNKDPSLAQAGKPWAQEETQRLLDAFDAGTPIAELARSHGRTKGGIAARLVKLGRIDERSEAYQRGAESGTDAGQA